ncbi:kinase-like domain-containing protein [Mycena rebaudengoi]|nr:kinase-like domain-containing protein [Mycena rebaudengoi]
MPPIRTYFSRRPKKSAASVCLTTPAPPMGINNKRILRGIDVGLQFKHLYDGVHEGPDPYHYPVPLPVPEELRPEDPRGPPWKLSDLECVATIGSGSYGQVLLVRKRGGATSDPHFAMKAVGKKRVRCAENGYHEDSMRKNWERRALVDMPWSPFVAGILQTFHDERNLYLILEYAPRGSLADAIRSNAPFEPAVALFYFANIVCGFEFLEQHRIVNRDVKPGNILVSEDGYLCLCDFGPAVKLPNLREPADLPKWGGEGTSLYQAPEGVSLEGQDEHMEYGHALDWWSAGIILFEMMTKKLPFAPDDPTEQEIWAKIMSGPLVWPTGPRIRPGHKLKRLVEALLTVDSTMRLGTEGAEDVMRDPWLETVDWNKMRRQQYLAPVKPPFKSTQLHNLEVPDQSDCPGLHVVQFC